MDSLHTSNISRAEKPIFLDGPALSPPPGVTPNFDHPSNANFIGVLTNTICLIISTTFLALRAYVKIYCVKRLHIEDYLIAFAFVLFIGSICCSFWAMKTGGLFVHQWNVRLRDISSIFYILHIGVNLCEATFIVLRASIILEYIRIFVPSGTRNSFFWIAVSLLIIHSLFHSIWIMTENLSCSPYRKIWDALAVSGTCLNIKALYISSAVMNLASNIILLVLPQKAIWSLQMSRRNKIGVSLIFMIGLLACLSAAFGLQNTIVYYRSDDVLFTESGMYLWALAEMTCLFLVFCVPAIPKAFVGRGLKGKARNLLLSRRPRASIVGPEPTTQAQTAQTRFSGQLYQQRRGDVSGDLEMSSVETIRGPVTEITADGITARADSLQGMNVILCTTELKTVVTENNEAPPVASGSGDITYEKYQRTVMNR